MGEEQAPFNSALDLLERLSTLLMQIAKIKQNPYLDEDDQQKNVLKLTKDFYIQSIPVLSEGAREEFKSILNVKQKEVETVRDHKLTGRKRLVYTDEVEEKINDTLIGIQKDLQDVGKYYMPPRKKLGKVVGDF